MRWLRCSWTGPTIGLLAAALATTACAGGGGGAMAGDGIEDVEWRLVRLDTGPVQVPPGPRAPSLTLESATKRAFGSGGCNRFTGGYERDGASLRFPALASTKMACEEMATESAYFSALDRTRSWRRAGARLELLDADGALVAGFETAPAP